MTYALNLAELKGKRTKTCIECNSPKRAAEFGKRPDLPGGRDLRCKVCICEGAKVSYRAETLRKLLDSVAGWPDQKIISELDWLGQKLEVITAELRRRSKGANG